MDSWKGHVSAYKRQIEVEQAVTEFATFVQKTANMNMTDLGEDAAEPDPNLLPPPTCPPSPPGVSEDGSGAPDELRDLECHSATSALTGDDRAAPSGVLQQHLRKEHSAAVQDLNAQMTRACVVKDGEADFLLTTTRSVQSAVALVSQHVQEDTLDEQSRRPRRL